MKIALIGATGYVGKEILNEAIQSGHQVTAIARNLKNILMPEGANKISLDVKDIAKLTEVLREHDIVVSSYNPGWENPNIYDEYLKGASAIQQATKKAGVKRLFVIGGAGSLFLNERTRVIDDPKFPKEIRPGALAASEYLEILKREKELDWTFFSPALGMAPGKPQVRRGTYRKGFDKPVFDENGKSELSVQDAAVAIIDEVENAHHLRERFTAGY